MSAVALGRIAPGPIGARDWLVSVVAHFSVLAAVVAWTLPDPARHAQPAPRPVPIRWVEATAQAVAAPPTVETASELVETAVPAAPVVAPAALPAASAAPARTPARSAAAPTATASRSARARPLAQPPKSARTVTTTRPAPPADAGNVLGETSRTAANAASTTLAASPDSASGAPEASAASPLSATARAVAQVPESASPVAAGDAPKPATERPGAPSSAAPRWRSELEALLVAHKSYPRQARRMGQQGVVTVHAQFAADGELLGCEVAASSGFRTLDEAALALVRLAAGQLRASSAPGSGAELRIPIAYELNGRGT